MSHMPVILYADDSVVRAIHGQSEFFLRPSVNLAARYGVPVASSSRQIDTASDEDAQSGWMIGEQLDKALVERPDEYEIRWPFVYNPHGEQDWVGREFVILHVYWLMGVKPTNNQYPLLLVPPGAPATFPLADQALYCQMVFEKLNSPAYSVLPSPLAALYGLNATTGAVLHIGRRQSVASVVTDSIVRWECATSVDIGQAHCEEHLEQLLMADEGLEKELQTAAEVDTLAEGLKARYIKEIVRFIFTECTSEDIEVPPAQGGVQVAVVTKAAVQEEEAFDVAKKLTADTVPQAPTAASHKSKKSQAAAAAAAASKEKAAAEAAAAADFIVVTIPSLPGKEISVGAVRHRLAEPLLKGVTPGGDTVWEALGRAVESPGLSIYDRLAIWDGVAVMGEMARMASFPVAVVSHVWPYLATSDLPSDTQATKVRLLSIPDYMSNYKNATADVAPFLGASMAARVVFGEREGKHAVNKVEYNARGPAVVYGVWQEQNQ